MEYAEYFPQLLSGLVQRGSRNSACAASICGLHFRVPDSNARTARIVEAEVDAYRPRDMRDMRNAWEHDLVTDCLN